MHGLHTCTHARTRASNEPYLEDLHLQIHSPNTFSRDGTTVCWYFQLSACNNLQNVHQQWSNRSPTAERSENLQVTCFSGVRCTKAHRLSGLLWLWCGEGGAIPSSAQGSLVAGLGSAPCTANTLSAILSLTISGPCGSVVNYLHPITVMLRFLSLPLLPTSLVTGWLTLSMDFDFYWFILQIIKQFRYSLRELARSNLDLF